jgi:hypothetical protein
VVVGGHKYFTIARELGLHSILAVVADSDLTAEFRQFVARSSVRVVTLETIAREMEESRVLQGHHVFFFDRPLDGPAKREFELRIAGFFWQIDSPLLPSGVRSVSQMSFAFDDTCAEFTALTPVGDPQWYGTFLDACKTFSREVVPIASYQGRRFAH